MSIPAFGWALEQGARLKLRPSDRLVLLFIADQANPEGLCRSASQERIERFTGLDRKTIQAATGRLVVAQLIRANTSVGMVTQYELLRPTPGNGTWVDPGKRHRATPGKRTRVAPGNGTVVGRENALHHPGKRHHQPRETAPPTPGNHTPVPSSSQESSLKTREAAARNDAAAAAAPDGRSGDDAAPLVPPKAPTLGTTTAGVPANALRPPGATSDDFRDWLDRGAPACLTTAAPDTLTEDDTPHTEADRAHMAAQLANLAASLASNYQNNYPPRAASMSADDQISTLAERPRDRAFHLAGDQLAAARAQLIRAKASA